MPPQLTFLVVICTASPASVKAQPYRVNYAVDSAITGVAFAGGVLFSLIPVNTDETWESELFAGLDEIVKGNFSAKSAALSDALVVTTMVTPLVAQLGAGVDEDLGIATLVYAETLGSAFLLNSAAKYLVQRPRPYVYSGNAQVQKWTEEQGKESHLSFYSGHVSMSFAAAVAGSYLFALRTNDSKAAAVIWGIELALATATANLRVRAGRHFYSDVIIGAVIGAGLGFVVPFLHQKKGMSYEPEAEEWAAIAGGVVVGALASQFLPLDRNITVDLSGTPSVRCGLVPIALASGAGVMLAGSF